MIAFCLCLFFLIKFYLFIQAFMLGCTFDLWSPPWSSRSYVLLLVLLAWAAPLALVTSSYLGIVGLVKDGLMLKEWRRKLSSAGSQEASVQVSVEQQQQINVMYCNRK